MREDCQPSSLTLGCTHQLTATDEDDLGTSTGSATFGSPLTYIIVANNCGIDVTSAGLLFPAASHASGKDFLFLYCFYRALPANTNIIIFFTIFDFGRLLFYFLLFIA
jgi:hypothetical protein